MTVAEYCAEIDRLLAEIAELEREAAEIGRMWESLLQS